MADGTREARVGVPTLAFEPLLRNTSNLINGLVELHIAERDPILGQRPPKSCLDCGKNQPRVFEECQARRSPKLRGDDAQPRRFLCPAACEVVVVPIRLPSGAAANLAAVRPPCDAEAPRPYDGHEIVDFMVSLARLISEHLSMSQQLGSMTQELTARSDEMRLLHTVSARMSEVEDLRAAIHGIVQTARETVGADAAIVSIESRKTTESSTRSECKDWIPNAERTWEKLGAALSSFFRIGNRRYYNGMLCELAVPAPLLDRPAQLIGVAIRVREELIGSLCLIYFGQRSARRSGEMRLLETLADRIASTLENSDLYENFKDFLMSTVKSLVSAIDAKDPYTSGHSERVNILSMLLGKTMGLSDAELDVVRWASLLHDVGKIGMPESILCKRETLTPEEFEIVKQHPDRGYKVLSPIRQLSPASLGVRCHHERIDGYGYPLGLRGEEIPLSARIISVADTYDALISTRSYRAPRSPDAAFEVIGRVRGTQLDPRVVDVLDSLMPFIREHQVMLHPEAADPAEGFAAAA